MTVTKRKLFNIPTEDLVSSEIRCCSAKNGEQVSYGVSMEGENDKNERKRERENLLGHRVGRSNVFWENVQRNKGVREMEVWV